MPPQVWIVVGVVALLALFAWLAHQLEKKRVAAFTAWAEREGWRYAPEKVPDPAFGFPLFDEGHSRYLRHAAERSFPPATPGLDGVRVRVFEYHYAETRGTGKNRRTVHYEFTCALVDPGLDLGRVSVRREGLGDKIAQALGADDIDLEDPEFSKRYAVTARERREAYDLLDAPMMRFLARRSAPRIESGGRELFLYESGDASPEGYDALARFALELLAQLPRPLVNAERARRGLEPLLEAGNASSSSRSALERTETGEA